MINKLYLNIISVTVSLIIFSCAQSEQKSDQVKEGNYSQQGENINVFEKFEAINSELSKKQLIAYEKRASQKVEDFLNYVEIISNPKIDEVLKKHSTNLTLELFINDSTQLKVPSLTGISEINIITFLNEIKQKNRLIRTKIKSVKITKPFKLDSSNNYTAVAELSIKIDQIKIKKNMVVHLINVQKKFGKTTQTIKEVRLGNLY